MTNPILKVVFYQNSLGKEPVREWLKSLPANERLLIGEDIKTVQYRWPLGMPLVKLIIAKKKIWEMRINLPNRIARVLFTISDNYIILLHGFIKKTNKTPKDDIDLALNRID
ncbi:MAG: hypothetical protein RLZZ210_878 [Pseudomonadota bacterium]|jgi:phage-related protein